MRVMENETGNRDMLDENNEGYKGRSKPFMNNKKLYMKEKINSSGRVTRTLLLLLPRTHLQEPCEYLL
jgi:hypothetical protein